MTAPITSFKGEHEFLSSFYEHPFQLPEMPGEWWNTREHAFQAAKAVSHPDFLRVRNAPSAYRAKQIGRAIECRPDWDKIKKGVMLRIMSAQFESNFAGTMREQLIATRPCQLIEGNTWNDTYWGAIPYGDGQVSKATPMFQADDRTMWLGANWLGRLLMVVRNVIADG